MFVSVRGRNPLRSSIGRRVKVAAERTIHLTAILVVLSFASFLTCFATAQSDAAMPIASVNPLIGTGTGPGSTINLFPGATLPFGMVQLSPDTEDRGYGYHYVQMSIQGFSMTHMSGAGCPNEGEVFFTATTGPVKTQVSDYQSPYSHRDEVASPGYYRVRLNGPRGALRIQLLGPAMAVAAGRATCAQRELHGRSEWRTRQ